MSNEQLLAATEEGTISTTLGDPGWENTTVLRRSPIEEVRELRDAPGRELGVTGSISVAHQLVAADLVDEYRLFVYPVIESGVALLRYERQREAADA